MAKHQLQMLLFFVDRIKQLLLVVNTTLQKYDFVSIKQPYKKSWQ